MVVISAGISSDAELYYFVFLICIVYTTVFVALVLFMSPTYKSSMTSLIEASTQVLLFYIYI